MRGGHAPPPLGMGLQVRVRGMDASRVVTGLEHRLGRGETLPQETSDRPVRGRVQQNAPLLSTGRGPWGVEPPGWAGGHRMGGRGRSVPWAKQALGPSRVLGVVPRVLGVVHRVQGVVRTGNMHWAKQALDPPNR